MSDRSRSPPHVWRTDVDAREADLRAALATAQAALAAAQAALAAERARAAAAREAADQIAQLRQRALRSMTSDIIRMAELAHRAGVYHDLVEYWYDGPPRPSEPEAEPEPE